MQVCLFEVGPPENGRFALWFPFKPDQQLAPSKHHRHMQSQISNGKSQQMVGVALVPPACNTAIASTACRGVFLRN